MQQPGDQRFRHIAGADKAYLAVRQHAAALYCRLPNRFNLELADFLGSSVE
jgi:hypothetical protein